MKMARLDIKDARAVNRPDGTRRLNDTDVRAAISYLEKGLDSSSYAISVGVAILLLVNVIAFVVLFARVASE